MLHWPLSLFLKDQNMVARYIEIKNTLRAEILQGLYQTGDKIPSERELAQRYAVTRVTLQKAMLALEQDGYIEKIHGKGMFVARTTDDNVFMLNNNSADSILGFSREFSHQGKITSRAIVHQILPAPDHIAEQLEIDAGQPVHFIRRLRYIDETPVLIEDSWIVRAVIKTIPEKILNTGSLYEFIEKTTAKKIKFYNSVIESDLFDDAFSALLQIPSGKPMLKVTGVTKLEDGTIFNYSCSYNRADMFKIKNNWVSK